MSTLEKYNRIRKPKEKTAENEIRITANGFPSKCISYALVVFNEKKHDTVVIKASGLAISKACVVAEVLRQRVPGTALISKITNIQLTDEYEPKEQGLENVKVSRTIAVLEITLKKVHTAEDEKQPGYQPPLTEEEIKKLERARPHHEGGHEDGGERRGGRGERRGGRRGGRGRGGRGGYRNDRSHSHHSEKRGGDHHEHEHHE